MPNVPSKVSDRISTCLKRFQPILQSAKTRDVNESDTVIIVTDILSEVFGYDKYAEITSEHAIKGTFVDLAIKLDNTLQFLIEVKAIGIDLKESHSKQAVDYAANQGVDWVALTNGVMWKVYKIHFTKPIEQELVMEFDLLQINPRKDEDVQLLYHLAKEGWMRSSLGEYHAQRQALSRFFMGAMILTDTVLDVVRRELRRVSPDVKIDTEQIRAVLMQEVIKREVLEGEKAEDAKRKINKASSKALRAKKESGSGQDDDDKIQAEPSGADEKNTVA